MHTVHVYVYIQTRCECNELNQCLNDANKYIELQYTYVHLLTSYLCQQDHLFATILSIFGIYVYMYIKVDKHYDYRMYRVKHKVMNSHFPGLSFLRSI